MIPKPGLINNRLHSQSARLPRRQRGLATVEMTLVLPLLMLLMLGTAELGHALYQYNALTKAVRDGARYLAANAIDVNKKMIPIDIASSDFATKSKNLVVCGKEGTCSVALINGLQASNITITRVDKEHIAVSASCAYIPMLFPSSLPTFGLGDPISLSFTLTASVTMRAL